MRPWARTVKEAGIAANDELPCTPSPAEGGGGTGWGPSEARLETVLAVDGKTSLRSPPP